MSPFDLTPRGENSVDLVQLIKGKARGHTHFAQIAALAIALATPAIDIKHDCAMGLWGGRNWRAIAALPIALAATAIDTNHNCAMDLWGGRNWRAADSFGYLIVHYYFS
jgi:hypothetical protein